MQPSRINLPVMKAQITKRIGAERSKKYFYYLNRLLSQNLRKVEFDRLCFRVLGRENLPLHNQFILSILKNACHPKSVGPTKSPTIEYGQELSEPLVPNQNPSAPIWSNGVVLPISPKKRRSTNRYRKLKHGKLDIASNHSTAKEDIGCKNVMENGNLTPCDYQRPMQYSQELAEQPDNEIPRIKESIDALSKKQIEIGGFQDGDDVEETNWSNISKIPLCAPLGIPLCSASVGGARKEFLSSSTDFNSCYYSGGLSDTETLRIRMEKIVATQGLGVVSNETASMLNNMLDVYLKRLIRSCVELVGARRENGLNKQPIQGKLINHLHTQSSSGPHESQCSISLLDFEVAMKLNRQQLGGHWPLLLEKICMHTLDEFTQKQTLDYL